MLITSLPVAGCVDAHYPPPPSPHRSSRMNVRNLLIPLLCIGAVAFACGPRSHSEASLVSMSIAQASRAAVRPQQQAKPRKKDTSVAKIAPSFAVQVDKSTLRFSLDVTNV